MRALILTALMAASAPAALAQNVYVTADRMLDVATGRMIVEPAIIIQDGVITQVGVRDRLQVPSAAEVIELPGVTLLPGLIDMHTHLDADPTLGGFTWISLPDAYAAIVSVPNARATLEAGFTTVRNVGSGNWDDIALKAAIENGKVPGPRIVPAGYSFGATGGHCDVTGLAPSFDGHSPYNADSPDEGRKRVREIRKYGAEVIKICATGGVFSHNTEPGQQQLTLAEMKAIAEEAHMWGLKVAAHAHGASGIRDAALAGIDTIEHASLVDDEGIAAAKKMGTFFSMDIYNTEYTQSEGAKNGVLEDNLRKDREIAEIQRQNFGKALKAGVKMVYGTDSGVYPHGDNAKQFAVMTRYGATPLQAIQTATINAADALGKKDKVGVIKPGAFGDLVGVKGDPLQNIRLLETPAFVMKGGITYKGGAQ
ncbi:MAG TPA: amidohydrolase family protein [Hyphomonadaceae bacterium]|nr:amidohydrolase family protein [Hyphomonadaceae bacterium]